jgi:hypothetical protein
VIRTTRVRFPPGVDARLIHPSGVSGLPDMTFSPAPQGTGLSFFR